MRSSRIMKVCDQFAVLFKSVPSTLNSSYLIQKNCFSELEACKSSVFLPFYPKNTPIIFIQSYGLGVFWVWV